MCVYKYKIHIGSVLIKIKIVVMYPLNSMILCYSCSMDFSCPLESTTYIWYPGALGLGWLGIILQEGHQE